jgi:hypothetical protein
MDVDFYKGSEFLGSIKLGRELSKKFVQLSSVADLSSFELHYPDDHEDAGNVMEAFSLEADRYLLAQDISSLIAEECKKILDSKVSTDSAKNSSPSNPKALADLLSMLLDIESTSFVLG